LGVFMQKTDMAMPLLYGVPKATRERLRAY